MDDVWGGVYWVTGGWSPSQNTVNFAAGFGDGVSLGLTSRFRKWLDIDGSVDKCSYYYRGSHMAGSALAVGLYAKWRTPKSLTHYTTKKGAEGIAKNGMRTGGGLFGRGTYATTVDRPWSPFVPPNSKVPIAVDGDFFRIIPYLVYLDGGSPVTAAWGVDATMILDRLTSDCGC